MGVETGRTGSQFRTTSWTLIARAPHSRADMEALLARYSSPVYAYLCRKGYRSHDAEDLAQAFLTEIVLGRDLVARADPARGRFRSFLKRALEHFVVDEHRRERGREGKRPVAHLMEDPARRAAEPDAEDDPARAFDREWATIILDEALRRVEAACRADGMHRQWAAFEARVLRPIVHGCEPTPYPELLERLGAPTEQVVYTMVGTIKRKVNGELRELIAETVDAPGEVQPELEELMSCLAWGEG
ncbi:MAG: sigma factor [Planctomycetota bacterium]|nr:sigma factor [Planctomycetota bacterium]